MIQTSTCDFIERLRNRNRERPVVCGNLSSSYDRTMMQVKYCKYCKYFVSSMGLPPRMKRCEGVPSNEKQKNEILQTHF